MDTSGDSLMVEQMAFQLEDSGSIPTSPLQLFIKLINHETAAKAYHRWHYLGDKGFIQTWGFGAYFGGRLFGAISFHPPSAPETVKGILGTWEQNGVFEIGRLAMSDEAPRNSESRFISVSVRLLRKATPVKAIITYADSGVGHVGTIYRASGFEYRGQTAPKMDFWIDGRIQERGSTRDKNGVWKPRSRKHLFVKTFLIAGFKKVKEVKP